MPLYTYACSKCNFEDDVLRGMSAPAEWCPKCGELGFKRVPIGKGYRCGLQFAGEGFSASTIKEK